jgi:hypothetical protein
MGCTLCFVLSPESIGMYTQFLSVEVLSGMILLIHLFGSS